MIPSPTPDHALESGLLGALGSPTTATNVRRSLTAAAGGQPQAFRQALTHLYEVDREAAVDPS